MSRTRFRVNPHCTMECIHPETRSDMIRTYSQGKLVVNNNKKKIFISGGSIVKHFQDFEITKKRDKKQEVYVRQSSSSQVSCMKDYVKPSIRENNPDHIIFNVGTNDVPSEKAPQVIARSIVDLVKSLTNDNLQVTVSSIVPQND